MLEPKHFVSLCSEYSETQTAEPTSSSTETADARSTAQDPEPATQDPEPTSIATLVSSAPGETNTDAKGGLSTGAKVIIPIALLIGLSLALALIFRRRISRWFWAAARKADKSPGVPELEGDATLPDVRSNAKNDPHMAELHDQHIAELHDRHIAELESDVTPGARGVKSPVQKGAPSGGLDGTSTPNASPRVEGRENG